MRHCWISCRRFTIRIEQDDDGIVLYAAPLAAKFIGQPVERLLRWICVNGWGPLWTAPLGGSR